MYVAYNNSKKNENNKKNRERCDREGSRAQKTKDLEWKRDRKKQQKKRKSTKKRLNEITHSAAVKLAQFSTKFTLNQTKGKNEEEIKSTIRMCVRSSNQLLFETNSKKQKGN